MLNEVEKKTISEKIKNRIIDLILNSKLNIESIPDDLERQMYESILDVIEDQVVGCKCCTPKCLSVFACMK
jgi:hypothetical protein